MTRYAVIHDFISLKMPEMESSVEMKKSQEDSGHFYSNFFFHGKHLKFERVDVYTPPHTSTPSV